MLITYNIRHKAGSPEGTPLKNLPSSANTVDKRVIRSHVHIRQLEAILLEMINGSFKTEKGINWF